MYSGPPATKKTFYELKAKITFLMKIQEKILKSFLTLCSLVK